MHEFLECNPGSKSKFDETFEFADYTEVELYNIASQMLLHKYLMPVEEAAS